VTIDPTPFLSAVVTVSAALLRRRTRAHAAVLEASRPARLAAAMARPQVTATPPPPAIVNNYGPQIHVYGPAGQEAAAALMRKALTEGKPQP
jgi:hypothetical protein